MNKKKEKKDIEKLLLNDSSSDFLKSVKALSMIVIVLSIFVIFVYFMGGGFEIGKLSTVNQANFTDEINSTFFIKEILQLDSEIINELASAPKLVSLVLLGTNLVGKAALIAIVLALFLFANKFVKNLLKTKSPFTKENIVLISDTLKALLYIFIFVIICDVIVSIIGLDLNVTFSFYGIWEGLFDILIDIAVLRILKYIVQYGYKMENKKQ